MLTKHHSGYLYRRGKNGAYYLEYKIDRKRIRRALRDDDGNPITSKKAAEEKRQEIMAPLRTASREKALRAVTHQLDDTIREAQELGRPDTPGLSLEDAWQVYEESVNRPDSGDRTLKGYATQWRQFVNWMKDVHPGTTMLADVGSDIAQEYARYLLSEVREIVTRKRRKREWQEEKIIKPAYTTNTYNKHIRVHELVFRVLSRQAGITVNPWTDISRKRENKASRRELTVEELNTICNKASGELQTLLLLGMYTGLRLGDCCTLRWSEVDLDRGIILRVPSKTARRKNAPVHVPVHPTLFSFLSETPKRKRKDYVLPALAARYQQNDSYVAKDLRKHFIDCGIRVHVDGSGKGTGKRAVVEVGFHSLRHSFVSLCRQANAPLAVVESIVGHSNPAMTRHYTHVGELAASQAVAALPTIGKEKGQQGKIALTPSGRDEKMEAVLLKSSPKTWKRDREHLLALLRGQEADLA